MPEPSFSELESLYSSLTPEERDELLQCLVIVASIGGDTALKERSGGKMLGQLTR